MSSFADLMSMAKQNADQARRKANASQFDAKPRRVDPKQAKLKQGVAAFLAKREEEDRRKKEEEKIKKEKLMLLRNQDRKAANRVRKMLSMTKSANKSCVDDAKDCLNESVAAQGEIQPDEDDYGYTSGYADMMHKKMMEKYKSIPIKPAFPEARVPVPKPQSLAKNGTGWRNKSGNNNNEYNEEEYDPEPEYNEPSASRKPEKPSKVPKKPPVDYQQLLQMASQKIQQQPALPTKIVNDKKGEPEMFEFGRPMTAKEKAKYLAEKDLKDKVARRFDSKSDGNNNSNDTRGAKQSASFKIPKANSKPRDDDDVPPKRAKMSEPEQRQPAREVPRPRPNEQNGHTPTLSRSAPASNRPNGFKQSPPSSTSSSRPVERSTTKQGNSPPSYPSKAKEPAKSSPPSKSDYRPASNHDRMERERPRPPPPPAAERDRVPNRKPVAQNDSRPRVGSSRDAMQERMSDARENSRNGMASMRPTQQKDADRRPMKSEMSSVSYSSAGSVQRREVQDRRDMPPPQKKAMPPRNNAPPERREMTGGRRDMPAFQNREMQNSQRREVPPQRKEIPPERRDVPTQRRDAPPQQRREPPSQRRDGLAQRRGMPPQRREMPPQRRELPPQRRDPPPPQRRDNMPMRSRQHEEPPRMKPKLNKGRAIIDSDEEYDSEMDDFIDDSEVDMGDISAEIGRIFNYDRRRFQYADESDDECMESSVHQQMMEEHRSLQIGIKEDLEDMAREEAEKKRAKMKMKQQQRARR